MGRKPEMQSKSVVLPAPFWPMRPRISPWRRSRSTSSTAWMPPKRLTMPRQDRRTGASSAGGPAGLGPAAALPSEALGPWRMHTDRSRSGRARRSAAGPGGVRAEGPGRGAEGFVDGDGGEDALAAGHVGHPGPGHGLGVGAGDVVPVERDLARAGGQEARHRFEERRLAGAVGAEEGHDL